ncbi:MAG: hypothetical protein KOO64_00510 [Desulfobacterales bacterium]|nr:hypothetical protein [Desulfobacterales bacterium]
MPLSFRSESHGNIAFGFFNIESDMLLLENYFFFADDFCKWLCRTAKEDDAGQKRFQYPVYYIADSNDIGDLMGAIHGMRFTGFIGKLYTLFPFPDDPEAFKQNPDGYQTRKVVAAQIESISKKREILIEFLKDKQVQIGRYVFDIRVFHELIRYVWQGGYPRWKEEIRPEYAVEMKEAVQKSCNSFFKGVFSS